MAVQSWEVMLVEVAKERGSAIAHPPPICIEDESVRTGCLVLHERIRTYSAQDHNWC
jgi:hypothetical protein